MPKLYRVTLEIEVDDKRALAAYAKFVACHDARLKPKEWADMRKDQGAVEAYLQMIFDPGESPPGTSIQQSFVETT